MRRMFRVGFGINSLMVDIQGQSLDWKCTFDPFSQKDMVTGPLKDVQGLQTMKKMTQK